jgi:precorrin-6Y C5,15-methyltransferase (decarboxylating)
VTARRDIAVVGIGADGWAGLGERARAAIRAADEVVGSRRQLELLPADVGATRAWPSPMDALLDEIVARRAGTTCVLASGDPMLHGIGATLVRRAGGARVEVHPHPSAFAIACARLGWPSADVELISAVARPPEVIVRALQAGRRIIAYVTGTRGAAALAAVLRERGMGASRFVVLEQLGGPAEQITESTPESWGEREADALHAVAIEVPRKGTRAAVHARTPGLPDAAYASDGQLTKRHVRAVTVAALAPQAGELLWDVGAGSGSIAIEWLRAEKMARAVALEPREDRAARIAANALNLGVPELDVRVGRAPAALESLPAPDVIFIGGGITTPGLLEACWAALPPGGRIVANTVTLEGEQTVTAARVQHGGTLTRIEIAHAKPVGGFTGWRAQMPVVQWCARKESGG